MLSSSVTSAVWNDGMPTDMSTLSIGRIVTWLPIVRTNGLRDETYDVLPDADAYRRRHDGTEAARRPVKAPSIKGGSIVRLLTPPLISFASVGTADRRQTAALSASATLSDQSVQSITSTAAWSSTNNSVAMVSAAGVLTAVSAGAADIRASYQGVTGSQSALVTSSSDPGLMCGTERWPVKTLSDADASRVGLMPTVTTIRDLNFLPGHCSGLPAARTFAPEFQVLEVLGRITLARLEDDRDYHIALADPTDGQFTVVTETADPLCEGAISSSYRPTLIQARSQFDALAAGRSLASLVDAIVRVRGVGFYDFNHGQTGRSDSCIELHPIVSIERVQ